MTSQRFVRSTCSKLSGDIVLLLNTNTKVGEQELKKVCDGTQATELMAISITLENLKHKFSI